MFSSGQTLTSGFNATTQLVIGDRGKDLAQFIKLARIKKGLSRPEAVSELEKGGVKVSYGYLNKLELGDRALASANIELREGLRRLYGISRAEWTQETGLYTPDPSIFNDEVHLTTPDIHTGRRIPVYDLISAGPGGDGGSIVSYIDLDPELVGPHVGYRISGESMYPEIKDGDTVVIQAREYASTGNIIVCWTPDDGMLCKYLERVEDGYYVLTSINPGYKPIWTKEIRIYGIVVEIRQRRKVINGNHS